MAGVEQQIIGQLTSQASDIEIMKKEVEKLVTFEKSVAEKIAATQQVSGTTAGQMESIKGAMAAIQQSADGVH